MHASVGAADEETVGAGADTGYRIAFEKGACLVIVGKFDLADIEEVKRLPLLWLESLWLATNMRAIKRSIRTERAIIICPWFFCKSKAELAYSDEHAVS